MFTVVLICQQNFHNPQPPICQSCLQKLPHKLHKVTTTCMQSPAGCYVLRRSDSSFLCILFPSLVFLPIAWRVINNQGFPFLPSSGSLFSSPSSQGFLLWQGVQTQQCSSAQQELFGLVFFLCYLRLLLVCLIFSVTTRSGSFLSMVRDCCSKAPVQQICNWLICAKAVEEDHYVSQGGKQELVNKYKHLPVFPFCGGFTLQLHESFHSV